MTCPCCIPPQNVCASCYSQPLTVTIPVVNSQSIALPSATSGQFYTFTVPQAASYVQVPGWNHLELIFFGWMDSHTDVEMVELFMERQTIYNQTTDMTLILFKQLCQRFRPSLTPEKIDKILNLKAFL